MDRMGPPVSPEFVADVRLCHSPGLPSSIQVLELVSCEPPLGFIAEDQVGFGERRVLFQVPTPANLEVPDDVFCRVRLERNRDQRLKQFLRPFEVGIYASDIQEPELGKVAEEWQIGFEVVSERGDACLAPLGYR